MVIPWNDSSHHFVIEWNNVVKQWDPIDWFPMQKWAYPPTIQRGNWTSTVYQTDLWFPMKITTFYQSGICKIAVFIEPEGNKNNNECEPGSLINFIPPSWIQHITHTPPYCWWYLSLSIYIYIYVYIYIIYIQSILASSNCDDVLVTYGFIYWTHPPLWTAGISISREKLHGFFLS